MKVLFVCIGNSCRSPMAESVLRNVTKTKNLNWQIDSAALRTWNVGYGPETRCIQILNENGLNSEHIARQINCKDFEHFDYIFGMDDGNIDELKMLAPVGSHAKIELLGSYCKNSGDKIILDPYFEAGVNGFRRCYEQIYESCNNFVTLNLNNEL